MSGTQKQLGLSPGEREQKATQVQKSEAVGSRALSLEALLDLSPDQRWGGAKQRVKGDSGPLVWLTA